MFLARNFSSFSIIFFFFDHDSRILLQATVRQNFECRRLWVSVLLGTQTELQFLASARPPSLRGKVLGRKGRLLEEAFEEVMHGREYEGQPAETGSG